MEGPKKGPTGRHVRKSRQARRPSDTSEESRMSSSDRVSPRESESESKEKDRPPRWLIKRKRNIGSGSSETVTGL